MRAVMVMVDIVEVPVQLSSAETGRAAGPPLMLYVEARKGAEAPQRVGEQEVSFDVTEGLADVTDAIRFVTGRVADALKAASPDKYTVEMGFELKFEAGKLLALLAHAGATATINVTLEWDNAAGPGTS